MLKGAIYLFAFSSFLFGCATQMAHPPPPPPSQTVPLPDPKASETSLRKEEIELMQKEEAKEDGQKEEKIVLKSEVPVEPLLLPDIAITDLFLNSKKRLVIAMDNKGNGSFPLGAGNLRLWVDGQLKGSYPLSSLSDQSFLLPKGSLTFTTPLTISGRHEIRACLDTSPEVRESSRENKDLTRILEGLPVGPDIAVRDLELTEDLELDIVLSNAGEVDLRKGVILRVRIFVNNQKISEFDHFTSEALKAHLGNRYTLSPPYGVGIGGTSQVKVSISTRLPSDDVLLENNVLERTFIVFPFRMEPQEREKFVFFVSPSHSKDGDQVRKVKAEARWDGGGSSLMLWFSGPGHLNNVPALSGRSPLKIEFPIPFEKVQKGSGWTVSIATLGGKRVEGHIIIQHP
jgi:hypothetical protein